MAQLSKGKTFSSGDTVTASDLNNLVDDGTIVDLAVTTAKLAANSVTEAKLGTDVDSDSLNFLQAGTGAAARTIQANLRDVVSVKDFGAEGDGVTDDSPAFLAAITSVAEAHVYVPTGTYRLDTMLELNYKETLELAGGARLLRTTDTANTDPVIWIKGNFNTIMGAGQGTSIIETENDSPNGIVLIGQFSMSVSPNDVLYNTVRNVMIAGSTAYGQTTGDPDVCLLQQAPQLEAPYSPAGKAVYFSNISGVMVQKANYGIWLKGWANANTISDIQGYKLGDDNLGDGALFYDNGSLDNAITNAFFHYSNDSTCIKMEKFDNTGVSGGREHTTEYSSYSNIVTEQSGTNATAIDATDGTVNQCYFNIRANCNQGNDVDSAFKTRNTLIGSQSVNEIAAEAVLTPKKFTWLNDDDTDVKAYERAWRLPVLTENTQYKLLTVDTDYASVNQLVEISIADAWGSGIVPKQAERAVFAIRRDASSTITVDILEHTKLNSTHRLLGGLTVPTIDGDDVVFTWKARNNGTATTSQYVVVKATVLGGSDDVVYHQTATVSTSTAASIQGPTVVSYFDNQVLASTDNTFSLGAAANRWSEVFAGTGTINTSDEREKQQIESLSSAELNVAVAIKGLIKKFKFNSAVEGKGEAARIHVGLVAQEIEAAFTAEGLDANNYGMFCRDVWHEKDGDVCDAEEEGAVERERLGVRISEVMAFIIAGI